MSQKRRRTSASKDATAWMGILPVWVRHEPIIVKDQRWFFCGISNSTKKSQCLGKLQKIPCDRKMRKNIKSKKKVKNEKMIKNKKNPIPKIRKILADVIPKNHKWKIPGFRIRDSQSNLWLKMAYKLYTILNTKKQKQLTHPIISIKQPLFAWSVENSRHNLARSL